MTNEPSNLNEIHRSTSPINRYYLPELEELVERVGNSSVLSTLDLSGGFHQIPMDESSSHKRYIPGFARSAAILTPVVM